MVAIMSKPTKEQVREAMNEVGDEAPDGAYWQMVHDILELPYGEVFDIIASDLAFFGMKEIPQC